MSEDTQPATPLQDEPAPTVEQAMTLFAERHDLSAILTDAGWLRRDGTIA